MLSINEQTKYYSTLLANRIKDTFDYVSIQYIAIFIYDLGFET